jgi:hypothetical protein
MGAEAISKMSEFEAVTHKPRSIATRFVFAEVRVFVIEQLCNGEMGEGLMDKMELARIAERICSPVRSGRGAVSRAGCGQRFAGSRDALGHTGPVLEHEMGGEQKALAGRETAKSAGGDVGSWNAEERDPGVQEPELVEQLSLGVAYGDHFGPANSHPLARMVVDLRGERGGVIDAMLGVDLRDGAGGYGEKILHTPSVSFQISNDRADASGPSLHQASPRKGEGAVLASPHSSPRADRARRSSSIMRRKASPKCDSLTEACFSLSSRCLR